MWLPNGANVQVLVLLHHIKLIIFTCLPTGIQIMPPKGVQMLWLVHFSICRNGFRSSLVVKNTGVLALKMDEFIKENFQEIGGQATRNAPLGWLGIPRQYKEDWSGTDDCY